MNNDRLKDGEGQKWNKMYLLNTAVPSAGGHIWRVFNFYYYLNKKIKNNNKTNINKN